MNNKLCDIIGTIGCATAFLGFVACFFGASCWLLVAFGLALSIFSQFEYED